MSFNAIRENKIRTYSTEDYDQIGRMPILFVCVGALRPSQQMLSHVGTFSFLLGLNQY